MDALVWHRDERLVWAESARASSAYGAGWDADAATGRPDVWPRAGDIVGAWAPDGFGRDEPEWLDVDFPDGTRAREVWVFETNLAGRVVSVVDRSDPDAPSILWSGRAAKHADARVLVVPIAPARVVTTLRLQVDASGHQGFPEIDAVALVRDEERGASKQQVNWRKKKKNKKRRGSTAVASKERFFERPTRGARIRLALVSAIAAAIAWFLVAPRGLVVSQVPPSRVESAASWSELASGVKWATESESSDHLVGPPDQVTWLVPSRERIELATVTFDGIDAKSIVLVESRPFAVVRIDDVSSSLWPVTIWRGATTQPRRGDHGAIRIDLSAPRTISKLRLVVDRSIARGAVDAVGVVPR